MKLFRKLKEVQRNKSAIWAANFYNLETLKGILLAARRLEKPVILQVTRGSVEYMGLDTAVAIARSMVKAYGVKAWLHLDHGDSVELVQICLDAGFDSVMIDASENTLKENIRLTRQVVDLAKRYGANVEAELGYVAKLGQSAEKFSFTEPEDARRFVAETGVNALAVAIGSAHGFYKQSPNLDIDRLKQIRGAVDVPLVLHGASGIPEEQLVQAVEAGICKINLATEIKDTFMNTIINELNHNPDIDIRRVFPAAIEAVCQLILRKMQMSG